MTQRVIDVPFISLAVIRKKKRVMVAYWVWREKGIFSVSLAVFRTHRDTQMYIDTQAHTQVLFLQCGGLKKVSPYEYLSAAELSLGSDSNHGTYAENCSNQQSFRIK